MRKLRAKRSRDEMSQDDSPIPPHQQKVVVAGDTAPGVAPPAEKEAAGTNQVVGVATVNGVKPQQRSKYQRKTLHYKHATVATTTPVVGKYTLIDDSENLHRCCSKSTQVAQNPSFMDTAIGVSIPPREAAQPWRR